MALNITPLPQLDIANGQRAVSLNIKEDTGTYQVELFSVEQDAAGKETLQKTGDLLVYPFIFRAPRTIKIALKNAGIDRTQERYYRLLLRQTQAGTAGIKIGQLLSFSVPVFVDAVKEHRDYKVTCGDRIKVNNPGNVHVKLVSQANVPVYVLPGRTVELPGDVTYLKDVDTKKTYCELQRLAIQNREDPGIGSEKSAK